MTWDVAFLSITGDPLAQAGSSHPGGQNLYVRDLSRHLGSLGLKIDVYSRRSSSLQEPRKKYSRGAAVYRIPVGPPEEINEEKTLSLLPDITSWIQRRIEARSRPYRLIHSHSYFSGAVGLHLKRESGAPLVHTYHSPGAVRINGLQNRELNPATGFEIEQRICRNADRIIAASKQEKIELITDYQVFPEKIRIIPCGVNLKLFQPQDHFKSRSELGFFKEDFLLTYAGQLEDREGIEILLNAVSLLKDPALKILIVGGPPNEKEFLNRDDFEQPPYRHYRDLQTAFQLEDQVIFTGGKPQHQLARYYSAADVTVIPSDHEPFNLTALQALACGSPVIASRAGGLQSIIKEGRVGELFEARRPEKLAEKIQLLQEQQRLQARYHKNARPYAAEHYNWKNISRQVAVLYRDLAGKH